VFALAAQVIELRPWELARDVGNIGIFITGFLHPSFAHVGEYGWQCIVTICIALWGTFVAIVIASRWVCWVPKTSPRTHCSTTLPAA
jgi:ABC-type phosphate/phosphonate transport system permease subunit